MCVPFYVPKRFLLFEIECAHTHTIHRSTTFGATEPHEASNNAVPFPGLEGSMGSVLPKTADTVCQGPWGVASGSTLVAVPLGEQFSGKSWKVHIR